MTTEQIERAVLLYYDDIMRYFVYRIRNRNTSEDLTQETFYRFIRYAESARYEGERKCRSYLYAIASRVCLDHFSRNADLAELDDSIPAPAAEREMAMAIEEALAALPEPQREAAVLYYYSGLRLREIARIQNASISAVKSRLKAARDSLRILLSEEDET
ncbi:MAG: RNA polymerase sigma factor [Ruminococcaceae bacterium]|nr:RNA polymerase sigma factor [Oscillospiraceae bacterium]